MNISSTFLFLSFTENSFASQNKTNQNFVTCNTIAQKYKIDALSKWKENLVTTDELIKEIDSNTLVINSRLKKSDTKVLSQIKKMSSAEKNMKSALVSGDMDKLISSMDLKISSITNLNSLCKKIVKSGK